MVLAPIKIPAKGVAKGAAAEGAALGRANAEAVLAYLRQHGPASAPSVGRAVGVSEVSARSHLHRMAEQGLVAKSGTRWSLTPAGVAHTGPTSSPADVADVFAFLPSGAHRAIARLILDAVVCRFHGAEHGSVGWPSFGLWGPPGLGKTTVPRVLGRFLGLADHEHVLVATDRGRADLLGRRVPDGKGAYRWESAPAIGGPVLTLDELDKARGETRDMALRLLQGDGILTLERTRVVLRSTVVATFNAGRDPREVLPTDRLRRMVLLHTRDVASPAECARAARALFDRGSLPVLDLARMVPAGTGDVAAFFDDELPAYLAPDAQALYPGHGLSLIVGGRMAWEGCDAETAAARVGLDYLTVAGTWGGTWATEVARYCRHFGGEAPESSSVEDARAIDIDERAEAVELAEAKALGARAIAAEVRELRRPEDDEGVRLRAAFAEVGRQLAHAQSVREVRHIDAVFAGLQERAECRAATIAGQRVAHGQPPVVGGRRQVPDRRAIFAELLAIGSKEPPAKVLARLGLIVADGHRWRGASPATSGAAVFERDGWADLAVRCILLAAIAEEEGNAVSERPQLGA